MPTNGAGWTFSFWMRVTGTSVLRQAIFEMNDGVISYVNLNVAASGTQLRYEHDGGVTTNLFSITAGTWYFVSISLVTTTTCQVRYYAAGATSLSAVTALASSNVTWALMTLFGNGVPGVDIADQFQVQAFKLFTKSLSDAELWEQSVRMLPNCPQADLDSYLPFYIASVTDEGGRARNWSTGGTMGPSALQPPISRGGRGRGRVTSAASAGVSGAIAATLPGLTAAATLQLADVAAVAATLPGLTAAATVPLTHQAAIAATLPGLTAAAPLVLTHQAAIAATLPGLTAAAVLVLPNAAMIAALLPGLTAAAVLRLTDQVAIVATLPGLVAALQLQNGSPSAPWTRRNKSRARGREARGRG